MDQGGQVVLLQAGLTADQHGPGLAVFRGLAHGLPQPGGVATGADDAPAGPHHQVRRQAAVAIGAG